MTDDKKPEKKPEAKQPEKPVPMMQRIIIQLADGRQGAFAGPALISEGELSLKMPKITNIAFTPPQPLNIPQLAQGKNAPPAPQIIKPGDKDASLKKNEKGA